MYIVVGSSTTAVRMKNVLEKIVGYPAYVVHTPAELSQGGCSYSVRADDRAMHMIKQVAADNGISFKKIYIEKNNNGERVFHAVS